MRKFLFAAFQLELWQALARRPTRARRDRREGLKESRYHLQHAADWVVRLGDGTEESHARMQRALDDLWPYTGEFFSADRPRRGRRAAGIGAGLASARSGWDAAVRPVLAEATLTLPARTRSGARGKRGAQRALGHLLAEMQFLQRAYPGGDW